MYSRLTAISKLVLDFGLCIATFSRIVLEWLGILQLSLHWLAMLIYLLRSPALPGLRELVFAASEF